MAHLVQVGAGSGGMPVLDMLCRDARISRVTLIEPDVYKPHNVERHLFGSGSIGQPKALVASEWIRDRRPDLDFHPILGDITDPEIQTELEGVVASADVGVCAADNETAKYHWDTLFRRNGKPWTLGEVLSGGIGGFVHWFASGGPCYGCVASHLQRSMEVEKPTAAPDYSNPGAPIAETTIPANKASIQAIAALHALVTLALLEEGSGYAPGFTSLLVTLKRVPGVFEEAFRPYRFRIPRAAECLICQPRQATSSGEDLDVALDQALARLGDA